MATKWSDFRKNYDWYWPGIVGIALIAAEALLGWQWVMESTAPDFRAGWYVLSAVAVFAILILTARHAKTPGLAAAALIFFALAVLLGYRMHEKSRIAAAKEHPPTQVPNSSSPHPSSKPLSSRSSDRNLPAETDTIGAGEKDKAADADSCCSGKASDPSRPSNEVNAASDFRSDDQPNPNLPWVFTFALSLLGLSVPAMVLRKRDDTPAANEVALVTEKEEGPATALLATDK